MVNTKLDIHICGPTSVFHFDPRPSVMRPLVICQRAAKLSSLPSQLTVGQLDPAHPPMLAIWMLRRVSYPLLRDIYI